MTTARPTGLPEGLVVELSRGKVLAGKSAEADRWMQMLSDRHDECVATLDRERMAIEIVFRLREGGEDFLYWVSLYGEGGQDDDVLGAHDDSCRAPTLGRHPRRDLRQRSSAIVNEHHSPTRRVTPRHERAQVDRHSTG